MTQPLPTTYKRADQQEETGLNWARIAAFTMVIAFHAVVVLALMAPVNPPSTAVEEEQVTRVVIIEPPPPEQPPVVFDEPSPVDYEPPPPAPPAPPAPQETFDASIDISSRAMNPPEYPASAVRAGIEGTVILIVDVDASGNVTNVRVERSSRNRDLDRAAMQAARRWRFNPSMVNGQPAAGSVRVPVDFSLGR